VVGKRRPSSNPALPLLGAANYGAKNAAPQYDPDVKRFRPLTGE